MRANRTRHPSNSLLPFRYNPRERTKLHKALLQLRPQLAAAAQEQIDAWQQDEEGFDEELGGGGCCDRVADAMGNVIGDRLENVEIHEGGQDGDDHAFLLVYAIEPPYADETAYIVDIPPSVYETGSGYSWRKRDGAQVTAGDVVIVPVGPVCDFVQENPRPQRRGPRENPYKEPAKMAWLIRGVHRYAAQGMTADFITRQLADDLFRLGIELTPRQYSALERFVLDTLENI